MTWNVEYFKFLPHLDNSLWGARVQDGPLRVVIVFVCWFSRTGLPAALRPNSQTRLNPDMQDPYALIPESQDYRTLTWGLPFEIYFSFVIWSGPIRISCHTVKPLTASLCHKSEARPNQSTGNSQNSFQLDFHFMYFQHVTSGL